MKVKVVVYGSYKRISVICDRQIWMNILIVVQDNLILIIDATELSIDI